MNPSGIGGFRPGVSGNPSGRSKELTEIRELARSHSVEALAVLMSIKGDVAAPASSRVAACVALLDRGFGRPGLSLGSQDESPVTELIVSWRSPGE